MMAVLRLLPALAIGGLVLGGACGESQKTSTPRPRAASGPLYQAEVLRCASAALPASFVAERGEDLARARPLFEQTRATALTTLSVYLGTGRWAGSERVRASTGASRDGTEEECRVLREISVGHPAARWPGPGPRAVAGIISFAYLPIPPLPAAAPPKILVRMAAVLVSPSGEVRAPAMAEATTEYASVGIGYQERPPQEVALALTERAMQALSQAVHSLYQSVQH